MGRVDGKVAIVTGAGSGIGEGMARALHAEGAKVLVTDISGNEEQVAADLGDGAVALSVDVTDDAALKGMVDRAVSEFGGLHVLCNNAGMDGEPGAVADNSLENWDRVLDLNGRAVFNGMRHGVPAILQSGGGSIINTASIAGLKGFPLMAPYCASKAAVIGMTKCAAIEYTAQGIRVNAICPGAIGTPLLLGFGEEQPEILEALKASTLVGRLGEPKEIAAMTVFLASDDASFVTGQAIPVDGGAMAQ